MAKIIRRLMLTWQLEDEQPCAERKVILGAAIRKTYATSVTLRNERTVRRLFYLVSCMQTSLIVLRIHLAL
jgi:hypothetical protein